MEVAKRFGCEVPFTRPAELSLDHTPGIDPVLHALEQLPSLADVNEDDLAQLHQLALHHARGRNRPPARSVPREDRRIKSVALAK